MSNKFKLNENLIVLNNTPDVSSLDDEGLRGQVQEYYAKHASNSSSCCGDNVAKSLYDDEMLLKLPEELTSFSLGYGDPITVADLQEGEVVLDLGSGGGLDCFMAAKQVGDSGRVIGIDMTPEMLERARTAAKKLGAKNVEFRKGLLEDMPVDDNCVDVIISNCVINLSPDKAKVFSEMYRALKLGGRVSVSDVVTNGILPESVQNDMTAWGGCVAGAMDITDYQQGLETAGFTNVKVMAKSIKHGLQTAPKELPIFSAAITARKSA